MQSSRTGAASPLALDALLFTFGAVTGFAVIAIVSHGGVRGRTEVGETTTVYLLGVALLLTIAPIRP